MFITCSTTGWEPCEEADRLVTVMELCSRVELGLLGGGAAGDALEVEVSDVGGH